MLPPTWWPTHTIEILSFLSHTNRHMFWNGNQPQYTILFRSYSKINCSVFWNETYGSCGQVQTCFWLKFGHIKNTTLLFWSFVLPKIEQDIPVTTWICGSTQQLQKTAWVLVCSTWNCCMLMLTGRTNKQIVLTNGLVTTSFKKAILACSNLKIIMVCPCLTVPMSFLIDNN